MAGLVGYDSSDEDEDVQEETQAQPSSSSESKRLTTSQHDSANRTDDQPAQVSSSTSPNLAEQLAGEAPPPSAEPRPAPGPALGPVMGPTLGPSLPPSSPSATTAAAQPSLGDQNPTPDQQDDAPRSPRSASRSLLRDLTLPAVADMDIPASPPQRPAGLDALNARLETLLELKRRAPPAHFNARLAGSCALRNPALMDKLLGFVGLDAATAAAGDDDAGAGVAQYETTLAAEVWDPRAFPAWAFKGPLRRSQEKVQRERERGKGDAVDFVPAARSRGGTPRAGGSGGVAPVAVTGKRKTRFDT